MCTCFLSKFVSQEQVIHFHFELYIQMLYFLVYFLLDISFQRILEFCFSHVLLKRLSAIISFRFPVLSFCLKAHCSMAGLRILDSERNGQPQEYLQSRLKESTQLSKLNTVNGGHLGYCHDNSNCWNFILIMVFIQLDSP